MPWGLSSAVGLRAPGYAPQATRPAQNVYFADSMTLRGMAG
jgi:hypothetical protein